MIFIHLYMNTYRLSKVITATSMGLKLQIDLDQTATQFFMKVSTEEVVYG